MEAKRSAQLLECSAHGARLARIVAERSGAKRSEAERSGARAAPRLWDAFFQTCQGAEVDTDVAAMKPEQPLTKIQSLAEAGGLTK